MVNGRWGRMVVEKGTFGRCKKRHPLTLTGERERVRLGASVLGDLLSFVAESVVPPDIAFSAHLVTTLTEDVGEAAIATTETSLDDCGGKG